MARRFASPAPNALPKVSFVKVTDEAMQQAAGVADQVARTYGCTSQISCGAVLVAERHSDNGPSVFLQEKHYIRYIGELSNAS